MSNTLLYAKKIYSHLEDEISKKIFLARINTDITSDCSHIIKLADNVKTLNSDILTFRNKLYSIKNDRIVVFGAGFNGQYFVSQLLEGNAFAFIDNYPRFSFDPLNGLPVYKPEEYIEKYGIEDTCFVISVNSRSISASMYDFLRLKGVSDKNIITSPLDYRNNSSQYFDVFEPCAQESFVDCGAFDGGTAFRFAGWCGNMGYNKIWCFEPDKISYEKCKYICSKLSDCQVYNYGVSDSDEEVYFDESGCENAHIDKSSSAVACANKIKLVKLDDFLGSEKVTFIKMDIEGEEINALKGASNIIASQKPRLAISAYHQGSDMLDIAELLLEIVPEYRFILRHYSLLINETVLYAYVK